MAERALRNALRLWIPLVLLRLVYLAQYLQLPFLFGPLFDSQVYLQQARAVRAGLLGDASLLAFSPLYGYLLAALDARPGSLAPLVVQLALGLLNAWLVQRITRRLFDAQAALWAVLCFSLYGPLLFFETKLMSEILGLTLLLLGLERLTALSSARAPVQQALSCGVWISLATLARASLLFTLPYFVVAAYFLARVSRPPVPEGSVTRALLSALRWPAAVALAIACVLGAYGTLTRAHSGLFVPVILVSDTVAQSTGRDWSGNLNDLASDRQQVSAFSVVEQAQHRLRAIHDGLPDPASQRQGVANVDVLGWLANIPGKAAATFRDRETTFDYGFYGERSELSVLHVTFATFGLVACLAAYGLYLATLARRWSALIALAPIALGVLTTTTLFHPSTRYRLPIMVVLAPLAGLALAHAQAALQAGKRRPAIAAALLTVLFAVLGATRDLAHPGIWELRVAESAAMAGDLPECRARVARALQREPGDAAVEQRAKYVGRLLPGCSRNGPR